MVLFIGKYGVHICCFAALTIVLFPLILLGEHTPLAVHDYLDSGFAYLKMFQDNNLLFTFDKAAPAMEAMPSAYFLCSNFNFSSFIFAIFPSYWAHIINIAVSMVLAYYGLLFLLKTVLPRYTSSLILLGTSFLFCILPNFFSWALPVASTPFIIVFFIKILSYNPTSLPYQVLLLIFYPFFSSFGVPGVFILGLWLLCTICISIYERKVHIPLLVGFIILTIGYIVIDARLFYMRFILSEPLTKSISLNSEFVLFDQLIILKNKFLEYFYNGQYHGPSVHRAVILPVVTGTFIISGINAVGKVFKIDFINSFFLKFFTFKNSLHIFNYTTLVLLSCIFIAALGTTKILNEIFAVLLPPLQGLSFARFFLFARFLWYVAFGVALCIWFYEFNREKFFFFLPKFMLSHTVVGICFFCIFCLQFVQLLNRDLKFYNFLSPTAYSLLWQKHFSTDNRTSSQRFFPDNHWQLASVHDYYAENLFQTIKKDIKYTGENALGFLLSPAILTYNGIRTPSGYLSVYPLKYMKKFRKLLEPEFEVNYKARDYYDSWGGRMYLYNHDTPETGYTLRINTQALRHEFNVKYIFSSVIIDNASEIGLHLHKKYTTENARYSIYLYNVD